MIILGASVLMCLAGLTLVMAGKEGKTKPGPAEPEEVFDPLTSRRSRWVPEVVTQYLSKLGLHLSPTVVALLLALEVFAFLVLAATLDFTAALLAFLSFLTATHLVFQAIGARQKRKLLLALPSFLNQVSRRLSGGISVEHAFTDSMENIEGPLELAMRRIMQRVGLGLELHQAFEREARANGLKELLIIATALHINEQFGGSIRSVLDDIVHILRLDDQCKRELSAQTGETRITALVLSVLPIAMIGLLFSMNPEFILQMWRDSFGKQLLVAAFGMQVLGVFFLWRMVKSI